MYINIFDNLNCPHGHREVLINNDLLEHLPLLLVTLAPFHAVQFVSCQTEPFRYVAYRSSSVFKKYKNLETLTWSCPDCSPVREKEECDSDVVSNQEPNLLYIRLHCQDTEVDHVGVVGPGDDARDDHHGQPLEDRNTKPTQPSVG